MSLKLVRRIAIVAMLLSVFVLSPHAYAAPSRSAPANDDFVNAQALADSAGTISASNVSATKEAWESGYAHAGNSGGASIWFTWTASTSQTVSIDTSGSDFDTLLAVYSWPDSSNPLVDVASNDDAGGGLRTSSVTFDASSGVVYYIAVDGYNGATGNVVLNWGPAALVGVPPAGPTISVPPAAAPTLTPTVAPTVAATCPPPQIAGFTIDNPEIKRGDSTKLKWGAVTNATTAIIDNGVGGVPTPGQTSVRPDRDTTFTLTANGCGGAATAQVSVKVNAVGPLERGIPEGPESYRPQEHFDWSNRSGYDGDKYLSNIEIQIERNGSWQPFETKENFELQGNGYENQKAFPQGKTKIRFRWWMSDRRTHQRISFKSDWSVICLGYKSNETCK